MSQEYPNIILIVADDLGWGDVGIYGSSDALTPHIDAIAQQGLLWKQFYVEAPACTPTRFSLLTGLHVNRASQYLQFPPYFFYPIRPESTTIGLSPKTPTLATQLQSLGYQTALLGKWHLGHGKMLGDEQGNPGATDSPFHPNHHGFQEFYGTLFGVIDYNTHYTGSQKKRQLDWFENKILLPHESGQYATQLLTQRAIKYLKTQSQKQGQNPVSSEKKPFFLYLAYTAPHFGYPQTKVKDRKQHRYLRTQLPLDDTIRETYLSRFTQLQNHPQNLISDSTNEEIRQRYLAMVSLMDDGIGEILETLKQYNIEKNTILVFLSDNGADTFFGGSNGLFRGEKFAMYEGGIRVPAMIRWPGWITAGQHSNQLAHVADIFPTLLSLIDRTQNNPNSLRNRLDGIDLSSHLLGGSTIDRDLFLSNPFFGKVYRNGSWKYVCNTLTGGAPELYNLHIDPMEQQNVSWLYPHQLTALQHGHEQFKQEQGFGEDNNEELQQMVHDRNLTILREKGFPL